MRNSKRDLVGVFSTLHGPSCLFHHGTNQLIVDELTTFQQLVVGGAICLLR
jgi:hypothetical protein